MFEVHTPQKHNDNIEWVSFGVYKQMRSGDGQRCLLTFSRGVWMHLGNKVLVLRGIMADANTAMLVSDPRGFNVRPNNNGSSYAVRIAAKRFGLKEQHKAERCKILGHCGVYEGKNAIRFVLPPWARQPIDKRIMGTYIADWGDGDD